LGERAVGGNVVEERKKRQFEEDEAIGGIRGGLSETRLSEAYAAA
jgi:hypothetical protein